MKTKFVVDNEKNIYEKQWIISRWYEKVILVVGYVCTFFFLIGFIVGILEEL